MVEAMTSPDVVVLGSCDYSFVSVFVSMLAASAALDLAERATAARGRAKLSWLTAGAAATGIGTWSMHYCGMRAFSLPVRVAYDWPTVELSRLSSLCAAAIGLWVATRREIGWLRALASGDSQQ
jgi:NO-binding membrane sensor protein with MHYT domain